MCRDSVVIVKRIPAKENAVALHAYASMLFEPISMYCHKIRYPKHKITIAYPMRRRSRASWLMLLVEGPDFLL